MTLATNVQPRTGEKVVLTPAQKHDALVKAARVFVAQTFFGEMFKQMRNSPFKSDLFDGGRGGQAFANQLDQKLAERMAGSHAGERLVRAMVRKIEHNPRAELESRQSRRAAAARSASRVTTATSLIGGGITG